MCQQWLSVAGLALDIVGFLLIAFEWRHMLLREHDKRMFELDQDYKRTDSESKRETYKDPRRMDYTMWRDMQRRFLKEWQWRRKIFYAGVALVILGFLGQTLGSLPPGV